ncbi:MAG: hypothetical protein SGBAC_011881 [Bacillariaceae sp.]
MPTRKRKMVPIVKGVTPASIAKAAATKSNTLSRSKKRRRNRSNINASSNTSSDEFSSTAESLAVISEYHTLNKRLEQNERDTTISEAQRAKNAKEIKKQQESMGGLDRYQKASIFGAKSSKFVCSDWVVPFLQKSMKHANGNANRIRILDVGAIDNQYHGKGYDNWLDAVPIDLHGGQHESVVQVDFFDYAHEYCAGRDMASKENSKPRPFDAIVMSLVLNFQGDPRLRGDMLALAADPRLLKRNCDEIPGMLFVALPSASLDNSRYCDIERFIEVVTNQLFHLQLVETKRSSKLILLAFQRKNDIDAKSNQGQKQNSYCYDVQEKTFEYGTHEMKRIQPPKPGAKRNNFAVILKSSKNREK